MPATTPVVRRLQLEMPVFQLLIRFIGTHKLLLLVYVCFSTVYTQLTLATVASKRVRVVLCCTTLLRVFHLPELTVRTYNVIVILTGFTCCIMTFPAVLVLHFLFIFCLEIS